jgi:hypothetical protein
MDSDKKEEITALETVNHLMTRIRGMLDILSDRQIAELSWPQVQLEIMLDRVKELGKNPPMKVLEPLEMEVYSLLDSEQRLQAAFFAASYEEIMKPCYARLQHFVELSRHRPLSMAEISERNQAQEALAAVKRALSEELAKLV